MCIFGGEDGEEIIRESSARIHHELDFKCPPIFWKTSTRGNGLHSFIVSFPDIQERDT